MSRLLILALVLVSSLAHAGQGMGPGPGTKGYAPTGPLFLDQFSGTLPAASPGPGTWDTVTSDAGYYSASSTSISAGKLQLSGTRNSTSAGASKGVWYPTSTTFAATAGRKVSMYNIWTTAINDGGGGTVQMGYMVIKDATHYLRVYAESNNDGSDSWVDIHVVEANGGAESGVAFLGGFDTNATGSTAHTLQLEWLSSTSVKLTVDGSSVDTATFSTQNLGSTVTVAPHFSTGTAGSYSMYYDDVEVD